MTIPNSGGVLRTSIADMQVGDYIAANWSCNAGVFDKNSSYYDLTAWTNPEVNQIPFTGSSSGGGFFYYIKVDKGLLIADRVVQNSISWDVINTQDGIQGFEKSYTHAGGTAIGIIRSLGGGNSYASAPNIIPTMTSNTSPSGVASSSSDLGGNYVAWKAFDKTTTEPSTWVSNTSDKWLAYDFGKEQIISHYSMTSYNSTDRTYDPKNWTLEGWDGSQWIILDSQVNQTFTQSQKKTYSCTTRKGLTKYRINISLTNGNVNTAIAELAMFDTSANGTSTTTDAGLGAWPTNNEWDEYIVKKDYGGAGPGADNIWHWSNTYTFTQDTDFNGITFRAWRGKVSSKFYSQNPSGTSNTTVGFRPVFQYEEVTP
jgi:hypothetical protein